MKYAKVEDMQGKIFQNTMTTTIDNTLELDISNYPKGIYLIGLKNSQTIIIEKLVIR